MHLTCVLEWDEIGGVVVLAALELYVALEFLYIRGTGISTTMVLYTRFKKRPFWIQVLWWKTYKQDLKYAIKPYLIE